MHPQTFIYSLLILILVFSNCKKSDDEAPESAVVIPKIKVMTCYQNNSISFQQTFEYDQAGRLAKRTNVGDYEDTFIYHADKIIISKHYIERDTTFLLDTLFLDSRGLVIAESGRGTYEYDAKGFQTAFLVGQLLTYQVSGENTVKREAWEFKNGAWEKVVTTDFKFLQNRANTIGNENMGISFYGKQDKNLRSEACYVFHENTTNTGILHTFHYEWDAQNRVIKFQEAAEQPFKFYYTYSYYD